MFFFTFKRRKRSYQWQQKIPKKTQKDSLLCEPIRGKILIFWVERLSEPWLFLVAIVKKKLVDTVGGKPTDEFPFVDGLVTVRLLGQTLAEGGAQAGVVCGRRRRRRRLLRPRRLLCEPREASGGVGQLLRRQLLRRQFGADQFHQVPPLSFERDKWWVFFINYFLHILRNKRKMKFL